MTAQRDAALEDAMRSREALVLANDAERTATAARDALADEITRRDLAAAEVAQAAVDAAAALAADATALDAAQGGQPAPVV
jgi:hypothetical protein